MILHHKGLSIDQGLIKFKKGFKYSDTISFIPIYYNKKEILIQSPNMYIPFDVIDYNGNNKRYLDLSFQNLCDKETSDFFNNLDIISKRVRDNYSDFCINDFIKERGEYKWMRFKLGDDTLFFNQNKEKLENIPRKTFGVFIISLNGLWLINNKIWFNWKILQSKLYIPIKLKEYYFIEEEDKSTKNKQPPRPPPIPPPPPPPLPSFLIRKETSLKDQISKNKNSSKQNVKEKDNFTPSINEIMFALKTLNKIS